MLDKTGKSTATTAYGNKLDTPLPYDYRWTAYADGAELVEKKDELTLEEQVKVRNTERQNNARQKALQAALDAAGIIRPTEENDPRIALRNMFKTLQTAKIPGTNERKYTDEQAREIASTTLGVEWTD